MRTLYHNNGVEITAEYYCPYETIIKCNSQPLIVIESHKEDEFKNELNNTLDKYRI